MSTEIIYPQRLRETIVGKGELSYIRTPHYGAPPPAPPPPVSPPPPPVPIVCTPDDFTVHPTNITDLSIKKVRVRCYLEVDGRPYPGWNFKPNNSEMGYIEMTYTKPSSSKPIYGEDVFFEYFNVNDYFKPAIIPYFYETNYIVNGKVGKINNRGVTVNSIIGSPPIQLQRAVVKLSFIPIDNLASDEIDFTILQFGSGQTYHSCARMIWPEKEPGYEEPGYEEPLG